MKIPSLWKQVMGERKRRRVLLSLKIILPWWKSLNSVNTQQKKLYKNNLLIICVQCSPNIDFQTNLITSQLWTVGYFERWDALEGGKVGPAGMVSSRQLVARIPNPCPRRPIHKYSSVLGS